MGCCGGGHSMNSSRRGDSDRQSDPIELLKARLIRGDISVDEYEKTLRVLNLADPTSQTASHAMRDH